MRALLAREGLADEVAVDSAGTGAWHVGSPPDTRARVAARARGFDLGGAARTVELSDFDDFDLLVAMDRSNFEDLLAFAPDDDARARVRMLREFDDASVSAGELDVPDPYYG